MKNIQRVVFFGTHELAVPCMETLLELGLDLVLIVTRPRAGFEPGPFAREEEEPPPHPVAIWAEEKGIELFRSDQAAESELEERIRELAPDILVVSDYGRPVPKSLVDLAPRGGLQVHPSLLPKLRGEHALRMSFSGGDKRTGVTVFLVDEDPWGGPILLQDEIELEEVDSFGSVLPRILEMANRLLSEGLEKLDKSKKPTARKQNPKSATKTPRLNERHRRAPWHLEASQVNDRLRSHSPPGLLTSCRLQRFEIVSGRALKLVESPYGESGTFLGIRAGCLAVLCARQGAFGIEEVRLEDGTTLNATDAVDHLGLSVGDLFV